MEKDQFINYISSTLPIISEQSIISEKEMENLLTWYNAQEFSSMRNDKPKYFFDWINHAIKGDKKSNSFLLYYQNVLKDLLNLYGGAFPSEIVTKIQNSICTRQESYMDYLGEILIIWHLLKRFSNEYEYLGVDYNLGNDKDADIAFRKGESIQLIEISNIHNLLDKDLHQIIRKRTHWKVSKKTEDLDLVQKYFTGTHPNCSITISILLFIWEDYVNLANQKIDTNQLKSELGDDFLPPITLLCHMTNSGEDNWAICPLEEAIKLYHEESKVE